MRDAATTNPGRCSLLAALTATVIVGVGGTAGVGSSSTRELSTAVLPDGFAVLDGTPHDRHVIQVDRDGGGPTRRAVAVVAPNARMVGTSLGVAVGWQDKDQIQFARVTGDGKLGEISNWGKRVIQMCEGTASNELRWGFGWFQKDGKVWMLHGPTRKNQPAIGESSDLAFTTTTTEIRWCGIASAGHDIALLWRDQRNRMSMNLCGPKRCNEGVSRLPIAAKDTFAGLVCANKACVMAVRDEHGAAQLVWMSPKGKRAWIKPLADATPDTTFSLVAAGDDAFAIGYVTREGATVSRVIASGSMVRAWADPYSQDPPVLSWASDRLLVAHRHGDNVAAEVVPLPR